MSSAGQIVGGIVGAVVGFFSAGPGGAVQGAMYGAGIGVAIGGAIDPPKGPLLTGPRLNDLSQQTSTYGAAIPRIYGTSATYGNVFWLEGNQLKETVKKKSTGGKGGGASSTTKTYTYSATFAVGLCVGPISGVRRLWVGGTLIYDAGSDDIETIIASNQASDGFVVYTGSDVQEPDPRMQADIGAANCPAFRGLAYIVFHDLELDPYGNSLLGAQVKAEVVQPPALPVTPWVNHRFHSNTYYRSAASPSRWVAVGPSANVAVSEDGASWSSVSIPVFGAGPLYGIAWGNDKFVALGGGYARVSPDGYAWSAHLLSPPAAYYDVVYADGYWYAVGTFGAITHSWSAELWSQVQSGVTNDLRGVAYGDGSVVVVGYGGTILKSLPGAPAFARVSSGTTQNLFGVCIGAADGLPLWVAVGAGGTILTSPDGDMWSAAVSPVTSQLSDIVYSGGRFIATINALTANVVTSTDGVLWVTEGCSSSSQHNGIATNGAIFVCTGEVGLIESRRVAARIDSASVPLSDIVESEIGLSALVASSDVDVASLSQQVRGYRISTTGAIRAAIEPLRAAWPFDLIQSGYKIKAVSRGGASVATIAEAELDARASGDENSARIKKSREMDSQLPAMLTVQHLDVDREYDNGEQVAERISTDAVSVERVELAISMTSEEAAQSAERLLYLRWLERYDLGFTAPVSFSSIEPADVVTIASANGDVFDVRLTQIETQPDGRMICAAKLHRAAVYSPTATGANGVAPSKPVALSGPCLYHVIDIPPVLSALGEPGQVVAMCGYTSGWPGGVLYKSSDGGAVWSGAQAFAGPVPTGYASTVIGAGRYDVIDAASALTVRMVAGELSSVSRDSLFDGANWFVYGAPGRWEIIAAQTATLQVDGSYILRDLLRGRFGTEAAAALHQVGDIVISLDDADLAWVPSTTAEIGVEKLYRGVTIGAAIDSDADRAITYDGNNLRPLSPVSINGHRAGGGDWSLSWVRRGRLDSAWRDYVDVPVGEASEAYEIDIYSSGSFVTLKRTLTSTTPTVSYTSAQQVADFGSNQATLYVRIYQMSATVGRGHPLQTSITR